jgi:hypothetical protein
MRCPKWHGRQDSEKMFEYPSMIIHRFRRVKSIRDIPSFVLVINDDPDVQGEVILVTHQGNVVDDDISEAMCKNVLIGRHPEESPEPLGFWVSFYMDHPAVILGFQAHEKRDGSYQVTSQILNVITSLSSGLVK